MGLDNHKITKNHKQAPLMSDNYDSTVADPGLLDISHRSVKITIYKNSNKQSDFILFILDCPISVIVKFRIEQVAAEIID